MTTIVVRNNPLPEYKDKYGSGLGQRYMIERYKVLLKELKRLESIKPTVLSDVKEIRKKQKAFTKQIDAEYNALYQERSLIEKHIDYCALFAASLDTVDIFDQDTDPKQIANGTGPYIVRAMASKKHIDWAKANNQDFIFLENGYFGNYQNLANEKSKKQWHRICVNELQQESILQVPQDRWQHLINIDPRLKWTGWKKSGSKILIVAPSSKPCQYYNQDVNQWLAGTIAEISKYTDREIVVREKASRTDRTQKQTIYDALDNDVFCMVTYQSIAAVEAVAYGIPVFTMAPSAAKLVGLQDLSQIDTPYYPDQDLVYQWCCSLAYGQFSLKEMLNGTAWNMVMENKEREKISC